MTNVRTLLYELKKINNELPQEETLFISLFNDYIYEKKIFNQDELVKFNHLVVKYLKDNKTTTYSQVVKKAKVLKDKVNWKELDNLYQKELKEWEKILEDLPL